MNGMGKGYPVFIYSFNAYFLSVYYIDSKILDAGDTAMNRMSSPPETGWDLGPFAAALAPGQTSPGARDTEKL